MHLDSKSTAPKRDFLTSSEGDITLKSYIYTQLPALGVRL